MIDGYEQATPYYSNTRRAAIVVGAGIWLIWAAGFIYQAAPGFIPLLPFFALWRSAPMLTLYEELRILTIDFDV